MSERYLLSARADKIQSFIFQSAKLKEVVGASFKLRLFGDRVAAGEVDLGHPIAEVLAFRGGNFRLVFENESHAEAAGWRLREAFEKEVGGTLVVYEPIPYPFDQTLKPQIVAEPTWHFPLQALCQSTGVYPAQIYGNPYPGEMPKYLSSQSLERAKATETKARQELFDDLWRYLDDHDENTQIWQPFDADAYAWDSRQYVAYLLADGNKMGAMFKNCQGNVQKANRLSEKVSEVVGNSLADAIKGISRFVDSGQIATLTALQKKAFKKLPVLPLILGGDDIFMLMPASWAVHVAARFCESYQRKMTAIAKELNVLPESDDFATVGVAVVICKASYPYKSAHEYGESLLEMVKQRAKESNESRLYVDIILGSTQPENTERLEQHPFYTPNEARILLNARYLYKNIPQRQLYTALEHGETEFSPELLPLDADKADWAEVTQLFKEHLFYQDLIGLWDFTHDLHRDLSKYVADK